MYRVRGLDLQCREASALWVIDRSGTLPGARRQVSAIILYGSFSRGDFHEGSDLDLAGDVRERFHKAGRRPSSISPISRSNRSATPRKSSPNWSGAAARSSTRHWPKASGCRHGSRRSGSPRTVPRHRLQSTRHGNGGYSNSSLRPRRNAFKSAGDGRLS